MRVRPQPPGSAIFPFLGEYILNQSCFVQYNALIFVFAQFRTQKLRLYLSHLKMTVPDLSLSVPKYKVLAAG